MTYCKNYCEEKGISTSELNEAQRTLYYIAENMKMDKSISEEGYRHFQKAIEALEQEKTGHWKRISMDKYTTHAQYWYRCDRCGKDNLGNTDWCPNCRCRMVEPQESEVNNG